MMPIGEQHPHRPYLPPHRLDCEQCDDCNRDTDPDDAAPSCGAHVLCVSCFETSDFRCRECHRVRVEMAGKW